MKKALFIFLSAALFTLVTPSARADFHLELGLTYTPTFISDEAYSFFSDDTMTMNSVGLDLRVEALEIGGSAHMLPFVSWRFDSSDAFVFNEMDTDLSVNDLYGGLRFKGWIRPWFGAFGQVGAGASFIEMNAGLIESGAGELDTYHDEKTKFLVSGLLGFEFRISPALLEKRNVTKFNFGGEIGVGFVKRAQTNFKASASGGDDYTIAAQEAVNFGDINLSGWNLQFGLTFHFL